MPEREEPLTGGRVTAGVVRVGDTVRRPVAAHSGFVHRLLGHLETRGFDGAPRFLGIDASGREILSFLPGTVPTDLGHFSDLQLAAAARLLRGFHDATLDCELRGHREVICHGDVSPCNCVFVDGLPIGLIDFDAAHAGSRREDVGYAAWLWLAIGDRRVPARAQGRRLKLFVEAYAALDSADAVQAVLDVQAHFATRADSPIQHRTWAADCRAWLESHRGEVTLGMA